MGSSQTRARTHVPCIGRRILNHCATREAHEVNTLVFVFFCKEERLKTQEREGMNYLPQRKEADGSAIWKKIRVSVKVRIYMSSWVIERKDSDKMGYWAGYFRLCYRNK